MGLDYRTTASNMGSFGPVVGGNSYAACPEDATDIRWADGASWEMGHGISFTCPGATISSSPPPSSSPSQAQVPPPPSPTATPTPGGLYDGDYDYDGPVAFMLECLPDGGFRQTFYDAADCSGTSQASTGAMGECINGGKLTSCDQGGMATVALYDTMDCSGPPNGETQSVPTDVCQVPGGTDTPTPDPDPNAGYTGENSNSFTIDCLPDGGFRQTFYGPSPICAGSGTSATGAMGECINGGKVTSCDQGGLVTVALYDTMDCSGPPNGETQTFLTAVCQAPGMTPVGSSMMISCGANGAFSQTMFDTNDCSGNGVTQTGAAGDCVNQQLVGTCDAGAVSIDQHATDTCSDAASGTARLKAGVCCSSDNLDACVAYERPVVPCGSRRRELATKHTADFMNGIALYFDQGRPRPDRHPSPRPLFGRGGHADGAHGTSRSLYHNEYHGHPDAVSTYDADGTSFTCYPHLMCAVNSYGGGPKAAPVEATCASACAADVNCSAYFRYTSNLEMGCAYCKYGEPCTNCEGGYASTTALLEGGSSYYNEYLTCIKELSSPPPPYWLVSPPPSVAVEVSPPPSVAVSPPPLPPPPPPPQVCTQGTEITFSLTIAGDVASFDAAAFKAALRAELQCYEATDCDIELTVSSSSINVDATLTVADQPSGAGVAGDSIYGSINTLLSQDVSTIGTALGVTVEQVSAAPSKSYPVAVAITDPNAPEMAEAGNRIRGGDSSGLGMGAIIGIAVAAVVVVVIAAVVIVLCVCKKKKKAPSTANGGAVYTTSNAVSATSAAAYDQKADHV